MLRILLAALLCASGCTIMATGSVPDKPPSEEPDCSATSVGGVFADILFGGLSAAILVDGIEHHSDGEIVSGGLLTTAFGASLYGGIRRGHACDAAKARHKKWAQEEERPERPLIARGIAGGRCYPNGTCDAHLACNLTAQICVAAGHRLPPPVSPAIPATAALPAAPARGSLDGACYENLTCAAGLHCDGETRLCAPGNVGSLAAPCFASQACETGLTCRAGMCEPP